MWWKYLSLGGFATPELDTCRESTSPQLWRSGTLFFWSYTKPSGLHICGKGFMLQWDNEPKHTSKLWRTTCRLKKTNCDELFPPTVAWPLLLWTLVERLKIKKVKYSWHQSTFCTRGLHGAQELPSLKAGGKERHNIKDIHSEISKGKTLY